MTNNINNINNAETLLKEAFQYILRNHPFLASTLFKLELKIDDTIETASTNGKNIRFNPTFIDELKTVAKVTTLIAHEVLHVIFAHHLRLRNRDAKTWNVATDYALNLILVSMGFQPIENWLYDTKYAGKSAEEIYREISDLSEEEKEKQQKQSSSTGDFTEPANLTDSDINKSLQKAKVEIIQSQAIVHRMVEGLKTADIPNELKKSKLSALTNQVNALGESIEEILETKVDWREVVNHFLYDQCNDDYSFLRPHPSLSESTGFFMPSTYSETFGKIAMALDVSASTAHICKQIASEAIKCLSLMDGIEPSLQVWYVSDTIHEVKTITSADEVKLHKGRGTDFKLFFERFSEQHDQPQGLIFVTDGYVSTRDWITPNCPVLWILTNRNKRFSQNVPFGECVYFIENN